MSLQKKQPPSLLITCEHASNAIPKAYQKLFSTAEKILETHLAYDIGAAALYTAFQKKQTGYYIRGKWSRLLVDLNRSISKERCFSQYTKALNQGEKQIILEKYYYPYRHAVFENISDLLEQKKNVLHLSLHSFTPYLHGKKRETDIGLLYDPARPTEKNFAAHLKNLLKTKINCRIRYNYPYKGISDGLTSTCRQHFPTTDYAGIEIECNQKLLKNPVTLKQLSAALLHCIEKAQLCHQ